MKRIFKWIGLTLLVLLMLLLLLGTVMYMIGGSKLEAQASLPAESFAPAADSAILAKGAHLVKIHACDHCHGEQLSGEILADAPPFLLVASNLTSGEGGIGGTYTDENWERAIRHGVRPDGRGMLVMPSDSYHALSDDELSAMIAHLRALPPVDNNLPQTEVKPLGRIIAGTGETLLVSDLIEQDQAHTRTAPPYGPTAEYGAYRASTVCTACHGENMNGQNHPDPAGPWSPSMAAAKSWGLEGFTQTLRTGVTPDGRQLDDKWMPWTAFRHMDDTELEALYRHIESLSYIDTPTTAEN